MSNNTSLVDDLLDDLGLADPKSILVTAEERAHMGRTIKTVSILLAEIARDNDTEETIFKQDAILSVVKNLSRLSRQELEQLLAAAWTVNQPAALAGERATQSANASVADNSAYLKGMADQIRALTAERDQLERDVASLRRTINSGLAVLGVTPDLSAVPAEDEFVKVAQNALDSAAASAAAPDPNKWVRIDEIGKPGTPGEPFIRIADIGRRNSPGQWFTTWQNVTDNFIAKSDVGKAGTPGENLVDKSRIPAQVDPRSYVLLTDVGKAGTNGANLVDRTRIPAYVDPSSYVLKSDIGQPGTPGENLVDKTRVISTDTLRPIVEKLKGAVTHKSGLRGLVSSDSVDVPKFDEAVEELKRLTLATPTQRMPRPGPRQP